MLNENPREHYIRTVLKQIRWKKARPVIQEELEGHIDEHQQEAKNSGLDDAAALENAVKAMGDPLETGRKLDRLHRPRTDVLMAISVAVLIAFTLALVVYSITAQYSEPEYIQTLILTFIGFGVGIVCASFDIRKMTGKASLPIMTGSLFGLLAIFIASRFFSTYSMETGATSESLLITSWFDLLPNCCLLVFLAGYAGWVSRLKKGDSTGSALAMTSAIAAAVLIFMTRNTSGGLVNAVCTVLACFSLILFSGANKKWKAAATVITAVTVALICLFYIDYAASHAEAVQTAHSSTLLQIALQNPQDLKLIGYAIPAPSTAISSAFWQPFGFMLLHFGILPALLPYAAMGVLIWRALRSSFHLHDRAGRTLAASATIYFAVRLILAILTEAISGGYGNSIPFVPDYGEEPVLIAGLLGLIFGLYRRKDLYADTNDHLTGHIAG